MKLKCLVFGIFSYVMPHFSAVSSNGGTSCEGSCKNFKCKPRSSRTSFQSSLGFSILCHKCNFKRFTQSEMCHDVRKNTTDETIKFHGSY